METESPITSFTCVFKDKKIEKEWSSFMVRCSNVFHSNHVFCFTYAISVAMTWLSVGYVGYCDVPVISVMMFITIAKAIARITKTERFYLPFDRPLNVAAFALGGVDIILTGLPLNSVPVSVADKSNRAAVLFALGTIMLIPKEAKLVISVLFVIGSGITWLFIDPVEYQGAAGLSITVGYVKVILGAAVACLFDERIRRETFLLIRKKISIRKLKHQGLLNEIPLYFQGVYLNTGEPVFLFHGDVAKRPQTIAGWIWSNIWIVWHQAVDLRFKDAALERQFRLQQNPLSVRQHLITVAVNLLGSMVPCYLSMLNPVYSNSPEISNALVMMLCYFPLVLVLPTLLLGLQRIRSSPLIVQIVILVCSVANIAGYIAFHVVCAGSDITATPAYSAVFHSNLTAISIAILSASTQSGLLFLFYLPLFPLLLGLNAGSRHIFVSPQLSYEMIAIPIACVVSYSICLLGEFQIRQRFLLQLINEISKESNASRHLNERTRDLN